MDITKIAACIFTGLACFVLAGFTIEKSEFIGVILTVLGFVFLAASIGLLF